MFVEDVREPPRGRFDGFGLLLCGVALSGLMFGLETAGRGVVPQSTTTLMIGVGLVAIVGYLLHARRHPAPLLDLSLMRLPCFGVAMSAHDAVPHRHRRHSVPAAADVAGRFRRFGGGERPDHLRQFGRRAGDEAGGADARCAGSASATR